jgi:hypothetical protein
VKDFVPFFLRGYPPGILIQINDGISFALKSNAQSPDAADRGDARTGPHIA